MRKQPEPNILAFPSLSFVAMTGVVNEEPPTNKSKSGNNNGWDHLKSLYSFSNRKTLVQQTAGSASLPHNPGFISKLWLWSSAHVVCNFVELRVNSFKPVFARSHTLTQISTKCGWQTGIRAMIIPGLWPQQLMAGWDLKTVIGRITLPPKTLTNTFHSNKIKIKKVSCVLHCELNRLNGLTFDPPPPTATTFFSPDRSSESSNSTTTEWPLLAMLMEVHWSYFSTIGPKLGSREAFWGMMSMGDCLFPFAIGKFWCHDEGPEDQRTPPKHLVGTGLHFPPCTVKLKPNFYLYNCNIIEMPFKHINEDSHTQ